MQHSQDLLFNHSRMRLCNVVASTWGRNAAYLTMRRRLAWRRFLSLKLAPSVGNYNCINCQIMPGVAGIEFMGMAGTMFLLAHFGIGTRPIAPCERGNL